MDFKTTLKSAPVLGTIISKLRPPRFVRSSATYWESRYVGGGHSGAGSYGRLAEFKAEVLNDFVARNQIDSVVEFGCGDGAQLTLANYPHYLGVDVSQAAIDRCRVIFAGQPNRTFVHASEMGEALTAELSLSLDVIYHLVEDNVFERYMRNLFDTASRAVIVYSSDEDRAEAEHVRHRKFSQWVEVNRPEFSLAEVVPNRYPYDPNDPQNTSFADFHIYFRKRPSEASK